MLARILLVDDDSDIAEGLQLRLNSAGYECMLAADGDAALAAALTGAPQAILLDCHLPKRDGINVLRELKHRPATTSIPVIMVSASLVEQQTALDSGARFFVSKPYDGPHLLRTLQYVLEESKN